MQQNVIEGTWEEIESRKDELLGRHLRVIIMRENLIARKTRPAVPKGKADDRSHRASAMGKYADILSSEDFIRRKQDDIDLEDDGRI